MAVTTPSTPTIWPRSKTFEKVRKYSRFIHSLITLLDHWCLLALLNTFSIVPQNCADKTAPLKAKGKVTKIKLQPYSFSLLQIYHPCTVPSNPSLPPAPSSLFHQIHHILSLCSSGFKKAFKFYYTQYPHKSLDSKVADFCRTVSLNKNSVWSLLNSGKNTVPFPPSLIPPAWLLPKLPSSEFVPFLSMVSDVTC